MKQRCVAGLMLSLGTVLVGSSWAREPSGVAVAPPLGELELELAADESNSATSLELTVRGTSAGSTLRRHVVLDAAQNSRLRLQLPAGAYAITLSAAALPDPSTATPPPPGIAEPSTQWLALPAAEVVLVTPGRSTRANVVIAPPAAPALASRREARAHF